MALIDAQTQNAMVVALTDFDFAGMIAHSWHLNRFSQNVLPAIDQTAFENQLAELE